MDKFQKVAAHSLILRKDGKFLVTHRVPTDDHTPNVYDLPGGSIEVGEEILHALMREIKEETGLEVIIRTPLFVYSFMSNPQRHQFQIIYKCEYGGGEIKLNPEEHDSYMWVTYDEAKELPKIAFLESFLQNQISNEIKI